MNDKKALIVIDVQLAMFDPSYPVFKGNQLLEKINRMIEEARSKDIPIIYVQHNESAGEPLETGQPGWAIHPLIQPQDHDIIVQKETPDSFCNTNLQQELDARGMNELILCGIQTEMCVDTTCRRAVSLGYKVILVSDAHSTYDSSHFTAAQIIEHHNRTLRWFAELKKSDEVLL